MRTRLFLFVFLMTGLILPQTIQAATITVGTTADANMGSECSLRDAISSLNNGVEQGGCTNSGGAFGDTDTVIVPAGNYLLTVSGMPNDDNTSGDLDILVDMAIMGADPTDPEATTIDGSGLSPRDRVIDIPTLLVQAGPPPPDFTTSVLMDGLNIVNGQAPDRMLVGPSFDADGGGIRVGFENSLEISNSRVANNRAGNGSPTAGPLVNGGTGGGIVHQGGSGIIQPCFLTVVNTVIEGNASGDGVSTNPLDSVGGNGGAGGGIHARGELTITHSTIRLNQSGNGADGSILGGFAGFGGGVSHQPTAVAPAVITYSTINNNTTGNGADGGTAGGAGGFGGGIYLAAGAEMNVGFAITPAGQPRALEATLVNNTISANLTGSGGAGGTSGGSAGFGGGVYFEGGGSEFSGLAILNNNTVVENQTGNGGPGGSADGQGGSGGGIMFPQDVSGTGGISFEALVANNIVANNLVGTGTSPIEGPNCGGSLYTDSGYNLESDTDCGFTNNGLQNTDPMLGPLADNGGPTETHTLLQGSPAIDAANPGATGTFPNCEADDQRGVSRPQGPQCDIGAVEVQVADLAVSKAVAVSPVATNQNIDFQIVVTNNGPNDANDVLVEDVLPAGLTFVAASPEQGTCTAAAPTVSCELGMVASGASVTIVITATAPAEGTYENAVTVSFPGTDPDPNNNNATAQVVVSGSGAFIFGAGCHLGSTAPAAAAWAWMAVMLGLGALRLRRRS